MKRGKGEKKEGTKRVRMPDAFQEREGKWVAEGALMEGRTLLLAYRVCLPAFKEVGAGARLSLFYARLAEELWRALEGQLFPLVKREYEESTDPHKRYCFARYTLTVDCSVEEAGEGRVVSRRAVLSRRGRVLRERVFCERFLRASGRRALPWLLRAAAWAKPKKSLRATLFLPFSRHTGAAKGEN